MKQISSGLDSTNSLLDFQQEELVPSYLFLHIFRFTYKENPKTQNTLNYLLHTQLHLTVHRPYLAIENSIDPT